jgi:hypothetical protein
MRRRNTGFSPLVRWMILERAGLDGDFVRCEVDGMWCRLSDIQIHHRIGRGAGSTRRPEVNQAANGVALCPVHHEWCEMHRTEAVEKGLCISKLSGVQPCKVPVELREVRWLLDNDGGITRFEEAA